MFTEGTTVKGAVDDLDLVIQTLEESGFSHDRFYIHCDGALFGLMMPFVKRVSYHVYSFCFNVCLREASKAWWSPELSINHTLQVVSRVSRLLFFCQICNFLPSKSSMLNGMCFLSI